MKNERDIRSGAWLHHLNIVNIEVEDIIYSRFCTMRDGLTIYPEAGFFYARTST